MKEVARCNNTQNGEVRRSQDNISSIFANWYPAPLPCILQGTELCPKKTCNGKGPLCPIAANHSSR